MPLEKVVLISGGGTGIGAAAAGQLAEAGAQVIITGRREEALRSTCEAITAAKPPRYFVADVSDRDQVQRLVEWVIGEFGRIDVLVNNAGVNISARRLAELAADDWNYLMDVNATGVFNLVQAVLPSMRARADGLVITVSSIAGCRPSVLAGAAYSASKHAAAALTRVVGLEEAANGIRATTIYPGEVNTPLLDQRPTPVSAEHRGRVLQPEDVAAAVLFLTSLPAHVSVPELVITPASQPFA